MLPQEIFNTVQTKLRSQREASTDGIHCMYRGRNGNRCAVGHLISDDIYDPKMEGLGISNLLARFELPNYFHLECSLIQELQSAHDLHLVSSLDEWELEMQKIAHRNRLIYTPEPL
jgi:hypothetical protein